MVLNIGDEVFWEIGRKPFKEKFIGTIFEKNPSIAPGAKFGILVNGEKYYPIGKIHRYKKS